MNYHHAKKAQKTRYQRYAILVVVLFVLIYFNASIGRGLSYVAHFFWRPVLVVGDNIGEGIYNFGAYFSSKKSLQAENESLKEELLVNQSLLANYASVYSDKIELEAILNRKPAKRDMTLGNVLSGVGRSPYDTLIIDLGGHDGIKPGDRVFIWGNIPIGTVKEVYSKSAKVVLYSSPAEETEVILSGSNASMILKGRGGGNFEMILPRDFEIEDGTQALLPGSSALVVAQLDTIISDPRDAYKKALLSVPVNIFELKFVQVEKMN